jgi:hypothetical protein
MVSRICWNCHFFIANDPAAALDGVCVRHAPKGFDFSSFNLANLYSYRLDFGRCLAAGTMEGDAVLPLHINGDGDSTPPTCFATDASGLNNDGILPFVLPAIARSPITVNVSASRLNSGAASVGSAPILTLVPVNVGGDTQAAGVPLLIPIPPASVQVKDTATDLFVDINAVIEILPSINPGLIGFRADLTGDTENDINQVRNLKIGILMGNRIGPTLTPETSKTKWAQITNGSTQNCGEFKPTTETIPAIPEI